MKLRYYDVDKHGTKVEGFPPLNEGDELIIHFADGRTVRAICGKPIPAENAYSIPAYIPVDEVEVIE